MDPTQPADAAPQPTSAQLITDGLEGKSPAASATPAVTAQTTKQDTVAAPATDANRPATLADVTEVVSDAFGKLAEGQRRTELHDAARKQFIGEQMKNIPAVYHSLLGDDPAKWEAQAKTLSEAFKADMQQAGLKLPDIGGDNPGGASPAQIVSDEKLSPVQLIEAGLKDKSPKRL